MLQILLSHLRRSHPQPKALRTGIGAHQRHPRLRISAHNHNHERRIMTTAIAPNGGAAKPVHQLAQKGFGVGTNEHYDK